MADYLLEIGCEEIPARMVERGLADLARSLETRLAAAGLAPAGATSTYGGPRRLAALLRDLPARQPDRSERLVGPPADKAFDASGQPTKAALSFAHKLGIEVGKLERTETPKGICVAGTRETKGEDAAAVLAAIVPEVVLGLGFAKTMRWGSLEVRFVRAIRSLVSLLDERVVEIEIAGVRAGRNSFGHRFLGARAVPLQRAQDYVEALRREHVVVEVAERRRAIEAALHDLAGKNGGVVDPDPDLVAEVIHLVEEPHVVAGRFDPAYLELPPEVLVTSIRHHQKGFPIWAERGSRLAPAMLAVANIPDVEGHVARGTERVLNARLADARFFWREDRKVPLADRRPLLERVVFHEKLGSYGAKTRRLEALAPLCAHHLGLGEEAGGAAAAAAWVAKADLVTGMVGEFAELQGVIGGLYLGAEGTPAAVARAVYEHYLPLSLDAEPPASAAGRALSAADKIDTLVGFFGQGLIPSGTKDPFGLRRAAQGLVKTVLAAGHPADLEPLLAESVKLHRAHPGAPAADAGIPALVAYLGERTAFVLSGEGHRSDTIDAVLARTPLDPVGARERAAALTAARCRPGFEELFTVFKRVANIAGAGGETSYQSSRFTADGERVLESEVARVRSAVHGAIRERDYAGALERVSELGAPLARFFEAVFVMDPDLDLRENRLRLLRAVAALVEPIGDFTRLQVEREGKA